ncbi:MAG: hypothetical protein HQ557_11500 [Bacteroidetes bacterium]|nr:hypothetical protein [Bacteroidota bacterium]
MQLGMNPGLGIRTLHNQGIIGKGIGIAVIDGWATLYDHEDLGGRVQHNEVVYDPESLSTMMGMAMHGLAMMSTVAGEQCGVAPDSDIYYLAATPAVHMNDGYMTKTLIGLNLALEKLLQIQENLPSDKQIRVISYSGLVDEGIWRILSICMRKYNSGQNSN